MPEITAQLKINTTLYGRQVVY